MTIQSSKLDRGGAQRLAAAVLLDAMKDALQGSSAAIYWLYSVDAAFYANLAGYDETQPLVNMARKCHPGRPVFSQRLNMVTMAPFIDRLNDAKAPGWRV